MSSLTPEKFQQLQKLFDQAVEQPTGQRDAWVAEACGSDVELRTQLEALLASDRSGESQLVKPISPGDIHPLQFAGRAIPRRLGPYELLEQIGRGGMGAVYKAQRVDQEYRSVVAIKLVRPEMDGGFMLSRFRRERQILAKLSHPNIARLLDGGTSEASLDSGEDGGMAPGIPYIVMEYISGAGILEYCQARRLTVRERIELFLPICAAVDYAHRNFIIHRDIKPGNILVDQDGVPKLLDFGICKLLMDEQLEPGMTMGATLTRGIGLMTPDYASPEQALGEAISPVSDVYSLGLVLYELLTDQPGHHIEKYTPLGIQEAVCQKEVLLPSKAAIPPALSAALRGDLDNILMKALQKQPERRYESAAAFAADLERYLREQPVLARPDTTMYRAKKFVRRNRLAVGASAAVLLAVSIGGGVALHQSSLARQRELEARQHERQAREMARDGLFRAYDEVSKLSGSIAARKVLVDSAAKYLDSLLAADSNDPAVLREIAGAFQRIGDLQGGDTSGPNLGDAPAAARSFQLAIEQWDKILRLNPNDFEALDRRARVLQILGDLEARSQSPRQALITYGKAVEAARALMRSKPEMKESRLLLAELLIAIAQKQRASDDLVNSQANAREGLSMLEKLLAESPANAPDAAYLTFAVSAAQGTAGMTEGRLGNLDAALDYYRQGVVTGERAVELDKGNLEHTRSLLISYSHVGDVLGNPLIPNLGKPELAVEPFEKMLAMARRIYESDPLDVRAASDVAITQYRLAAVLPASRAAEQKSLLESSEKILKQQLSKAPQNLTVMTNLANVESLLGDYHRAGGASAPALLHYKEAVSLAERLLPKSNVAAVVTLLRSGMQMAHLQARGGQGREALALLDRLAPVAHKETDRLAGQPLSGDDIIGGRSWLPRLYAAYSAAHASLHQSTAAAEWRDKALAAWQELATKPGFDPRLRNEMMALQSNRS